MKAVADTAVLVAAIRARESARDDHLFTDPFAQRLAGETGAQMLARMVAEVGDQSTTQIVVRTRFWDEALLRATAALNQVVIVAAGLDARAYRLAWPAGTTLFELDQPHVMAAKAELLTADEPRCRRVALGVDLAEDWPDALRSAGFDPGAPSVWLIEGLLQYLEEAAVRKLFTRIDALAVPGSVLLYDVVGAALLNAPFMAGLRKSMAEQGSPWLFATDAPGELAERLGWSATVTDVADSGHRWGRWPTPAASADVPDAPRGYFVEAHKTPPGAVAHRPDARREHRSRGLSAVLAGSLHTGWPR
ncbi:MAG TPA: SAM-dependent methyltransferase [Mycobacterium sp.]